MIFLFPDLEALRIALTSGQVPPDVSREPVEVAFDAAGRPSVKPHAIPPKAMQNALKRLGIKTAQSHHGEPITLESWPQILPVVRVSGTPEFSATTPVLFELPIAQLGTLATEMLRLGNDRQSFRVFGDSVLLRVIGPPYYTLLRAIDRLNADVAAYVELAPRVWVEIGSTHPLTARIKVADGQMLLLRSPRVWKTIADEPFQDLDEVLDFQLPKAAVAFAEGKLKGKLTVPLRLAAGNAAEVPEMWVLKENAFDVFDAFVRDADDRLMSRLMFAVAEKGEGERGPVIVLRTRTSKLAPPAIELAGALGYVPFRRLGNLFLPAGTRLQPTLRRDAVRKMLAEDDAQIVWLTSSGDGRFVPESLPDAAFRPLPDWVDYVIDQQRQPLQNWMQATRFDFDDFICQEENPLDAPTPGAGKPKTRKPGERPEKIDSGDRSEAHDAKGKKKSKAKDDDSSYASQAPAKPDELKIQRTALEQAFLGIEGTLDAPERLTLWPRLAQLNAALGDHAEAAICWLNGFWEMDEISADAARAWLEGESSQGQMGFDLGKAISRDSPTQADLRSLAAYLAYSCAQNPLPKVLVKRLPAIRALMETHEASLPIRATWLVWRCLTRISSDILGLARIRDRLLERLFNNGLDLERDVPRFIRMGNREDSGRLREILEHTTRIRNAIRNWLSLDSEAATTMNRAYADLMFAFGHAVLGERSTCNELFGNASSVLSKIRNSAGESDGVHSLLRDAFAIRIEQALAGQAHRGKLPNKWHSAFEDYAKRVPKTENGSDSRWVVERFCEQSWILEPEEKLHPYRSITLQANDLNKEIVALSTLHDPVAVAAKIKQLLFGVKHVKLSPETRLEIAVDVLPLCPRAGVDYTRKVLDQIAPLIEQTLDRNGQPVSASLFLPINQAKLLERALVLAVSYDSSTVVKRLAELFSALLENKSVDSLLQVINLTSSQCIRSLRRIGMRDQAHALLLRMDSVVKESASRGKVILSGRRETVDSLCARLNVAGAWLYFNEMSKAVVTLDEARTFLSENTPFEPNGKPWHPAYSKLARTYVIAASQGPISFALDRIEDMFKNLSNVANTYTSATHFSRLHLNVVEEVVVCLMQPDAMLGETARRWRDDDEYLVRRRIHGDMRALLAQSGL